MIHPSWRVTVKDLLDAGLLKPDQELRFFGRDAVIAIVTPQGSVFLEGVHYKSPTAAARAVTGTSTNGWKAWKSKGDDQQWNPISDLRERLRSRV